MTSSKIFLWILLSGVAGIGLRSFILIPLFWVWFLFICGAVIFASGIAGKRKLIVYGVCLIFFAIGILRFHQKTFLFSEANQWFGKPLSAEVLVEESDSLNAVQRIKVKVSQIEGKEIEKFSVLVTARMYPRYVPGEVLRMQGIIKSLPAQNWEQRKKEGIEGEISFPIIEKKGERLTLKGILFGIKSSFEGKIEKFFPEPQGALLKGLLLGERANLPADFLDFLQRTGTTHIVALSGYNITIIARVIITFLLLLTFPFRLSFGFAVISISGFVLLTGASPSVVRAGIMGILVLIAEKEGRSYQATRALAIAGTFMVFQNPLILVFDVAFQLSFLATLGLIFLAPALEKYFEPLIKPMTNSVSEGFFPLRKMFIETLSAQIMVLPLLIFVFGKVSLISPIVNILVLIAVPYAMGFGFLTGFSGYFLEIAGQILFFPSALFLGYIIKTIEIFSKIPLALIEVGKWILLPLLFLYAYFLWKFRKLLIPSLNRA